MALEQVALPEQGIVVQVGDEQALVQLLGLVAMIWAGSVLVTRMLVV